MTEAVRTRYSTIAIALHWLIGLAIIANLCSGLLDKFMPVHKSTGITIFVLTFVRLLWRLGHRPPSYETSLQNWEVATAKVTHWAFYILTLAIPLSGWLMTSAGGRKYPIDWYGLSGIPFLPVAQNRAFADVMGGAHENLSYLLIALLVLHIGAAMKHIFLDGDGTFARMLPGQD
jgi:cytochrome b561